MPAIAAAPIFYGAVATGAAGVATGVLSSRAQSGAANRASRAAQASEDRQLAYMRERDAVEEQRAAEQRAVEQRNYDAQQAFAQRQFDAQEEERLYRRRIFEEDRAAEQAEQQAIERSRAERDAYNREMEPIWAAQREAQIAPKRALRDNALATVGSLLNMGTPGYSGAGAPVTAARGSSARRIAPPPPVPGVPTAGDLLRRGVR